jgi:hypothetical protein
MKQDFKIIEPDAECVPVDEEINIDLKEMVLHLQHLQKRVAALEAMLLP